MMEEAIRQIVKTDGKRKITIKKSNYEDAIEVGVCRNGYQTNIVPVDTRMIDLLMDALKEYSNAQVDAPSGARSAE